MRYLLSGADERIAQFVSSRIPNFTYGDTPYSCIGLVNEQGHLLAGVLYDHYTQRDIYMSGAAVPGARWMTRQFLGEIFRYPFLYLGCERMTGLAPSRNTVSQHFQTHLGFKYEGRMRSMLPDGDDLLIFGMLKSECRWLNTGKFNGNAHRTANRSPPVPERGTFPAHTH